jgi:hypothetical protein
MRAVGATRVQNTTAFTQSGEIGNPVTDFSPGPNPAVVEIQPQILNGYLLPADSFDSLYGEFLCNTPTK